MHIKIYIRTTEPWSQFLVQYLRSKDIPFSKVEISTDQDGYQEMIEKSGQKKVPVIEIGDQIIVGFNRSRIDELLKLGTV